MIDYVFTILLDRQVRIEQLLELDILSSSVDEDVRSARGKLMIMTKNRLKTFRDLTKARFFKRIKLA
jgi:hypothetical protein